MEMGGTYNPAITAVKALGSWLKWLLALLVLAFLVSSWILWLRIWWDKGRSGDPRQMLPSD